MLAEFFYLNVHFLFLPFDKFLSVKIFLVNFFYLTNLFFEIFSTHQIFTWKIIWLIKKCLNLFFSENDKKVSKNGKKVLSENQPYGRLPYGWL